MCGTQLDQIPLDELERRLTTQAAIVASETAVFLQLLAVFDQRRGWAVDGVRSCAHWMNWQLGTSFRTAREQLRVAQALTQLPLIEQAFVRGELSYSRVRAVTRIALPETEGHLLDLARSTTGAQLETMVRAYRTLDDQSEQPPTPPPPRLSRLPGENGRVVITLEVDPVDAEVVWAAVHEAMVADAERPLSERRADALVAVADSYLAQGPAERSGPDRTRVVVHADARSAFLADGTPLASETAARATCDARTSRKSPGVSQGLRRQLELRDGGCIWPGCGTRHHLHAHHVVHREHGGPTQLDNLVLLCGHHHRVLHNEHYSLARRTDSRWDVRRADGTTVERTPKTTAVPRSRRKSADPTATTIVTNWSGERLDRRQLAPIPVRR